MAPPSTEPTIGPFRVLRPLAQGGTAEVYEVEDPVGGERVALKLLLQTGTALPRFNREYEAMSRLNHPNIVRVYQYGIHEGHPWLTMELVQGRTLQGHIKGMGRPGDAPRMAEVLRVSWYVAEALRYVHERGLVHRDLKSDNVLVLPDGRVKLLDFGTAHVTDALEPITMEGEFVGTFAYAAPEQLAGGKPDARSDLYSMGVMLYRMCTGVRVFDSPSPVELAKMHASTPPEPPRKRVPSMPRGLEALILSLLEKDPARRPQSAAEVAKAIATLGPPMQPTPLRIQREALGAAGREEELLEVLEVLRSGRPGAAVVIEGAEGSGRQAFCSAVHQEMARRGRVVGAGAEDPLQVLGASAGLLPADDRAEMVSVLQAFHDRPHPQVREALQEWGVRALEAASEGEPLVVVLPELHLASASTLELLWRIRKDLADRELPVRWLGTCLLAVAAARQRLADAHWVRLTPLSVQGIARAVGALLQRRPPRADLARWVHRVTGGQPAYLREVLEDLLERGALQGRGLGDSRLDWVGDPPIEAPAPSAARDVERALWALPRAWRQVLEVVAVAGGELELDAVSRVLDASVHDLRPLVDGLVDAGWLRRLEPRAVAWGRPVGRRVLEGDLSALRRQLLRRRLLDGARNLAPRPRAGLLLEEDRLAEALHEVVNAGESLLSQPPAETEPLLAELLARLDRQEGAANVEDAARSDLELLHLRLLVQLRPLDPEVPQVFARLQGRLADDPSREAALLFLKARLQSTIGHYPNYRKILVQAWERAQEARRAPLCALIGARVAQAFHWIGQPKTASEWFERARRMAQASGDQRAMARTASAYAAYLLARGEFVEAERRARAAAERLAGLGDDQGQARAVATWAGALREQGRYTEALETLYRVLPQSRSSPWPGGCIRLLLVSARCEVDLHRLGRAQEWLDELEALIRPGEHLHLRLEARLIAGRILFASGQHTGALEALNEVYERAKRAELIGLAEHARALQAEALWALGDRDEARQRFRNAVLGVMGSGEMATLAETCASRARAMSEEEDPAEIFSPVNAMLQAHPTSPYLVEQALAQARRHQARHEMRPARQALKQAASLINAMAAALDDTDRAALRIHPWSRQIRRMLA